MAGYHKVLVGLHHEDGDTTIWCADARPVLTVGRLVELDPEPAADPADGASYRYSILADAGGEHDPVNAPERCCERTDLAGCAIAEHLDRKSRARLLTCQELAKIRGDAG